MGTMVLREASLGEPPRGDGGRIRSTMEALRLMQAVGRALDELPEEQREVLRMLFIESKSLIETAQALDLPVSTTQMLQWRGLASLRRHLAA